MNDQAPQSQDLWYRDVLPRSHKFWRRLLRSKDQFTLFKELNVNLFKKNSQIVKIRVCNEVLGPVWNRWDE